MDKFDANIVNEGFGDEKKICYICRVFDLDNGELTRYESYQRAYSSHHLKANPSNGITEICPYCGEVWCE